MEKILYLYKGYLYLSVTRIVAMLSLLFQLLFCILLEDGLGLCLSNPMMLGILFFSLFLPFYISLDLMYIKSYYMRELSLDISSKKEVEKYLLHEVIDLIGKT